MFTTPPIPSSPTRSAPAMSNKLSLTPTRPTATTTDLAAADRFLMAAIAASPLVKKLQSESIDPRIDDLFHAMVVPPIGFIDQCTAFISKIKIKRDEMFHKPTLTRSAFDKLFENDFLYRALLGDNGVAGYYCHRGDPATHDIYAPHMAHTLISEKYYEKVTRGTDHTQKCKDKLQSVNDVIARLNTILKFLEIKPKFAEFEKDLKEFIEYYELHRRCLTIALEFDKARDVPNFDRKLTAAETQYAEKWGSPGALTKETPQRPGTHVYELRRKDRRRRGIPTPSASPYASPERPTSSSSSKRTHSVMTGSGDLTTSSSGMDFLTPSAMIAFVPGFMAAAASATNLKEPSPNVSPVRHQMSSALTLMGTAVGAGTGSYARPNPTNATDATNATVAKPFAKRLNGI